MPDVITTLTQKDSGNPVYPNIQTANIPDGAVTTNKLASKAVTATKIATSTITATQLASSAVSNAKIASNAVTTAKIADANVTTAKLATGAVTSDKLADGAVTTAKIATGAVGTTQLDDGAVTKAKIGTKAVTIEKIKVGLFSVMTSAVELTDMGATIDWFNNVIFNINLGTIVIGDPNDADVYCQGLLYTSLGDAEILIYCPSTTLVGSWPNNLKNGSFLVIDSTNLNDWKQTYFDYLFVRYVSAV